MKIVLLAAIVGFGQTPSQPADRIGAAYEQFLIGHYLESNDDVNGAIAAYKRAMALDPSAAEIPAELAALYMRQSRAQDALDAAAQALKIDPANREANRVAGFVYAALGDGLRGANRRPVPGGKPDENLAKALAHLEKALERPAGDADPNVRATLARVYVRTGAYTKAIALLTDLVNQEPGWQEGPFMLAEAKTRQASALLQLGTRADAGTARDLLGEVIAADPKDAQALYLLSQAERRLGNGEKAEATARQVIAQNGRSPWGYYALAETLEDRHEYQAIVDALAPAVADMRPRASSNELLLLLPHLAFAYQELGQLEKALPIFEEARKLAPNDVRLARLQAQALRKSGKIDQGIGVLQEIIRTRGDDPSAYVALAALYSEADRGAQAVTLLQEAQKKFPDDASVVFELGAVFDKQKRYADAEAAFKQVLARDPEHAPALNYLGYMLAEHGVRLDESVDYIKKALAIEPDNGSYLDSLGWAYYKQDKLDLAEENLKKAAAQLAGNSVIQEHYGDLLFKRGRYDEAIVAWTKALAGDGESIDRGAIDRKIQSARQKIRR